MWKILGTNIAYSLYSGNHAMYQNYKSAVRSVRLVGLVIKLVRHMYLSVVWLGVDLRMDIKEERKCVQMRLNYGLNICYHSKFNSQCNWGVYMNNSIWKRSSLWIWNNLFIKKYMVYKLALKKWLWPWFACANCVALILCLIKWVQS